MKPTKEQLNQLKKQPITMTPKQIEKIQNQATDKALNVIIGFSLMALRDEYEFGHDRLERFYHRFMGIMDAYNENLITLPDVWQTITDETGITFNEEITK